METTGIEPQITESEESIDVILLTPTQSTPFV
jgi:hypothetical protein